MFVEPKEYTYEWDLEKVNNTRLTQIKSPAFSFNENEYELSLTKIEGQTGYGCFLRAINPTDTTLNVHFRLELVKRSNATVNKTQQISFPILSMTTLKCVRNLTRMRQENSLKNGINDETTPYRTPFKTPMNSLVNLN